MEDCKEIVPNLFDLVSAEASDLDAICKAVRNGADVNAVNKYGENVLQEAVDVCKEQVSLDLVRLLVELGADIRYEEPNGGNVLSSAMYRHEPDLIACLLRLGADPNAVIDRWDTPLDMAEIDLGYHECELRWVADSEIDLKACEALTAIIGLLKSAGAKSFRDMVADRPRKWITVYAVSETGITTRDGQLDCEKLPNVTQDFCQRFRRWLETHFDTWPDRSFDTMPVGFDRIAHNEDGRRLARKIKQAVGDSMPVEYAHICPEWEAKRIRNVVTETL